MLKRNDIFLAATICLASFANVYCADESSYHRLGQLHNSRELYEDENNSPTTSPIPFSSPCACNEAGHLEHAHHAKKSKKGKSSKCHKSSKKGKKGKSSKCHKGFIESSTDTPITDNANEDTSTTGGVTVAYSKNLENDAAPVPTTTMSIGLLAGFLPVLLLF